MGVAGFPLDVTAKTTDVHEFPPYLLSMATKPPPERKSMESESFAESVTCSTFRDAGSAVSRRSVARYGMGRPPCGCGPFRKAERSMRTLRAVEPLVIARNQVFPLRRAKAATCRISETGRTTVSSQVLGIALSTSTDGLS